MLGFAVTGTLTTLLMLGVYVCLNKIINYQYSYLIAYAVSVIALYFLNVLFVFKKSPSLHTFLQFPFIYLLQYAVGAVSLEFLVRLGFSQTLAPAIVVIIMLPVTFILNRLVLLKK